MIVLMSAYGYDLVTAFLLAIGAYVLRRMIVALVVRQVGIEGL